MEDAKLAQDFLDSQVGVLPHPHPSTRSWAHLGPNRWPVEQSGRAGPACPLLPTPSQWGAGGAFPQADLSPPQCAIPPLVLTGPQLFQNLSAYNTRLFKELDKDGKPHYEVRLASVLSAGQLRPWTPTGPSPLHS